MERRSFLAAVAAAPASLLLPFHPAPVDPVPPPPPIDEAPTYFWAKCSRMDSGNVYPWSITSTEVEALDSISNDTLIRRYRFRPLKSPSRFRIVESVWQWPLPERPHRNGKSIDQWFADIKAYHTEMGPVSPPQSLIDVPPGASSNEELHERKPCLFTRCDALAHVAQLNRERLEEIELADIDGQEWFILVEVGRPIPSFVCASLSSNGVGSESRTRDYPIRLVRPTAEEMTLYPI